MSDKVVILAHATDSAAEPVAARLIERLGPQNVRIIRPETLSLARWSHHVDSKGHATTRVAWPNQATLESAEIGAVLNRIRFLPVTGFYRSSDKDRDYAGAELQAVVSSWLASFGNRAVHPVRRHPLLTPVLPRQHWTAAAAAVGLPVALRTVANSARAERWRSVKLANGSVPALAAGSVLIAGNRAGGTLAGVFGPLCLEASQRLGFPLLDFRFVAGPGGAMVSEVDPLPVLDQPWEADLTARLLESLATGSPQ